MKLTIEIRRPGWMTSVRLRRARPLVLLLVLVFAGPVLASDRFSDVPDSNVHHDNISAIANAGITLGCATDPPSYCPSDPVLRDQMGSFLARTAGLGGNPPVTNADKLDGLDSTALQRRVTGTCAAGSSIRAVNVGGTVTCETDDVNGGDAATLDGMDSTAFAPAGAGAYPEVNVLDSADEVGTNTSIAIGADGLGLISYRNQTNGDLKVAHCTDVACSTASIATLDSSGDVGANSSITIGADGRGLISYYDETNSALKVAHCSNLACFTSTAVTIDSEGDVGRWTSIAIGADGRSLISYHDQTGGDLRVAH